MTPVQDLTSKLAGVLGRRVRETPIAVLDFETTGMLPGVDRVVEAAVVRIEPGQAPKLAFDSLINPGRPMACTHIHGITESHIADAPTFADVAGDFLAAIEGCVVAAYNVAFDSKFLHFEMANAGCRHRPPNLCLMYLRPLLGLGVRCRLEHACRIHGVDYVAAHVAAGDAFSAAGLLEPCFSAMDRIGVETFNDLMQLGRYRFLESLVCQPLADAAQFGLRRGVEPVSRGRAVAPSNQIRDAAAEYWAALNRIVSVANLSDDEMSTIRDERARGGLKADHIRVMHSRIFAEVIGKLVENGRLDREGVDLLRRTRERLSALGWAPGD